MSCKGLLELQNITILIQHYLSTTMFFAKASERAFRSSTMSSSPHFLLDKIASMRTNPASIISLLFSALSSTFCRLLIVILIQGMSLTLREAIDNRTTFSLVTALTTSTRAGINPVPPIRELIESL